MEMPTD